jgi:cell division control protein 45
MALHRAIISQGTYILDQRQIKPLRSYRLAYLTEGADLAVFRHPSTLLRLAVWLVDTIRDIVLGGGTTQKKAKTLPFVLACLNESNDAYLVVGVVGAVEYGDVKKK